MVPENVLKTKSVLTHSNVHELWHKHKKVRGMLAKIMLYACVHEYARPRSRLYLHQFHSQLLHGR